MNLPGAREKFREALFSFSEENATKRSQWLLLLNGLIWMTLSLLNILIHYISADQRSLAIVLLSFAKYLPILVVPYLIARTIAAEYLTNIFELEDTAIADQFITFVAFGTGFERITIDEGRVNPKDMNSAILLIGGPGVVQVNLNNVAVAEKPDGEPRILYPRNKGWRLEGFERIREIGVEDEKPKYAIINLKDQFLQHLSLATRTKDGIMIEAHDIKVLFSVRKSEGNPAVNEIYTVPEDAVYSLVYKQTVLVGSSKSFFQPHVPFPWDSTILPLVFSELEDIITRHTLSEILSSIGQKELDQTIEDDQEISSLKSEITGQQRPLSRPPEMPEFQPRSKITARFYEPEFIEKAAKLGVQLLWIDIGIWKLPSSLILTKHKDAWDLSRENAQKRAAIQHKRQTAIRNELVRLINDVVLNRFEEETSAKNIPITTAGNIAFKRPVEKKPEEIAKDILRAFRKELLAAHDMYVNDVENLDKNREVIDSIQNAIREINYFTDSHIVT